MMFRIIGDGPVRKDRDYRSVCGETTDGELRGGDYQIHRAWPAPPKMCDDRDNPKFAHRAKKTTFMRGRSMGKAIATLLVAAVCAASAGAEERKFSDLDIFELEIAGDPQVSPDGKRVIYQRRSMDIMRDRVLANIWIVDADGGDHRPLLSGTDNYSNARWSPAGDRIAYVTNVSERGAELFVRWMDTGQTALLSNLPGGPGSIEWSPDGTQIAFTMLVEGKPAKIADAPAKPEGAEWAPPVKVIDTLPYRGDGAGYLKPGYTHIFVIPAESGTPRQLTSGDYDHDGSLSWSPDGSRIVFSANRIDNPIERPAESELWTVEVASGELQQLTSREGPDVAPRYSPDGKSIAYRGYDDKKMGYHNSSVYLLDVADGSSRNVSGDFDRSIDDVEWAGSSSQLYVQYDDRGRSLIASMSLNGKITTLSNDTGGEEIGRPYTSGGFAVGKDGSYAYTMGRPDRPADVGFSRKNGKSQRLTNLNEDLFAYRDLGTIEEIVWPATAGEYEVQGWLVKPPDFDPSKKYPLILEIHGGPFAAYGPQFSAELQLFAAAGYVVLYTNPRGSTSYGYNFANEIHHNYPAQDYDDLMAGVDAVIANGYVDDKQLFVTGGSGGGVLTAWIVGKTPRFAAAVVAKPVINWGSFVLTADASTFFVRYWFASMPWEDPEAYWKRSPLSLVGNVSTPTMLLTGEQDFRTPIAESEQYYQALMLRGIDTALVRVPEASHGIAARPSHLIAKVDNILGWFARYRDVAP
jgi:acylaminoacyl-peptidase